MAVGKQSGLLAIGREVYMIPLVLLFLALCLGLSFLWVGISVYYSVQNALRFHTRESQSLLNGFVITLCHLYTDV